MTQPTPTQQDGADDLAILYPDRKTTIAGVAVVMREYTFAETLEHHRAIAAFTDAITDIAITGTFNDMDSLRAAFGEQREQVYPLIAVACGQPEDWVRSLGADDGEALLLLWWSVNGNFFLRRVLTSVQLRKVREVDGPMFSTPSPVPGTTPSSSGGARVVN